MNNVKSIYGSVAQGNKIEQSYNYEEELNLAIMEIIAEVRRTKTLFPTNFHNQHEA